MSAHVLYSSLDKKYPASLSYCILTKLLQNTLGFRGCIVSDDLNMLALKKFYPLKHLVLLALNAGVDLLMICNAKSSQYSIPEWIREGLDKNLISLKTLDYKIKKVSRIYLSLKKQSPPSPSFIQWRNKSHFLNQHFLWNKHITKLMNAQKI